MGYTKLFSDIITSTIWQESNDCKVLWIALLALREKDHIVRASIPGLAHTCKLSIEDTEKYMEQFSMPDRYSRSQEFEGRRIKKVDGGWLLLNGEKYRNKLNLDERREYNRLKQREYRSNDRVQSVRENTICTQSETETETETDKKKREEIEFDRFWKDYPKKVAKQKAMQIWKSKHLDLKASSLMTALEVQKKSDQWQRDGGKFIPHPATWLSQERWEDEGLEPQKTQKEKIMEALR